MPVDLALLKTEVTTDPTSLGYSSHVTNGATGRIADLMNEVRDTIEIASSNVNADELLAAIVPAEWAVATEATRSLINLNLSRDVVNMSQPNVRAAFASVGTTTAVNVDRIQDRKASRAEELFGESVTHRQIADALRL